jgi:hypothetical protein
VGYERYEHDDFHHHVHDLDSASDESDQDDESDDGLELDDELHESASLSSWQHHEDAFSLKSWNQTDDDCISNQSYMLSWEKVEDHDAKSNASFTMVGGISSSTAAATNKVDGPCGPFIPEYGSAAQSTTQEQQEPQQQQFDDIKFGS